MVQKYLLIGLCLGCAGLGFAQERTPRRVLVPPPASVPSSPSSQAVEALDENLSIVLKGGLSQGDEVEFELVGAGTLLSGEFSVGKGSNATVSLEYSLAKEGERYRVGYRIETTFPVPVVRGENTTNYEYRRLSMRGTVLAKPGQPVLLSRSGEKSLTLTVSEAKEE